ncbi:MAG: PSD1 and planctomycete cytochrome C domain-containing protein [Fuerstiella sp.]
MKCTARTLIAAVVFGSLSLSAAEADSAAGPDIDFSRQILPILSNKCFICHGPDSAELGEDTRRLDSFEAASKATESGKAIDPDAPENSLILARIHSADDPMPPVDAEKQLTAAERDLLTSWVRQGGQYAKHWAFIPPQKVVPPGVEQTDAAPVDGSAVIDAFIRAPLRERHLDFSAEADKPVLARRVALVLTGLPPETEQLNRFLADTSPGAWDRLVEELLASPRYGEHQARYWLDAVRYGDTHGLHLDNRRGIYPYRDWVVRALNQNLPLNDFITWQVAGDLLPAPTMEQQIATGFVRMNPTTSEGGAIPAEFQAKNNFDRTETLGTVLLGMSLTCARCHTHKYDPVPQTEYYRLLAFFNSTAEPSMDGNKYEYGPTLKVPPDQQAWQEWRQLQSTTTELTAKASQAISNDPAQAAAIGDGWKQADVAAKLAIVADPAGPFAETDLQTQAAALTQRRTQMQEKFTTTLVARDLPDPRPTHVLRRGEYNLPIGEPVEPGFISVMGTFTDGPPRNRMDLAKWLTSPQHPLVSRVLVNRVWQRVFGYGLVRTPEDFGLQGEQPTHPELLDWLAVELQDSGWDLKHMLRIMVHSRTFRQSSASRSDVSDPENRLFARASSYRLDAEVLRDTGLWAAGLLDPHMGGEGVKPYQPPGMWKALAHPASNTKHYEPDTGDRLYRRSLYVYWKRTSPHPMMTLFDAPDRESSCVRRSRTNTSLQSLGLFNETQRVEMSRRLAERLLRDQDSDAARVNLLFGLLTCREATETEQSVCRQLLAEGRQRFRNSPDDAARLLSVGEISVNDQLDRTETAAWTLVTSTVLASDAAIMLY